MGLRKHLKESLNFSAWMGLSDLKKSRKTIKQLYKETYQQTQKEKPGYLKTFDDYVKYYQLSEADLKKKQTLSGYLVYCYFGISLGAFLYMFYQFLAGHILGGLLCLMLSALLGVYGLKEQIHWTQIKKRKLGIGIKESLKELIK